MADDLKEPLAPEIAKQLIRRILKSGRFTYSKHALEEILADDLTTVVVIAFRSSEELVVVTAWRVKSR